MTQTQRAGAPSPGVPDFTALLVALEQAREPVPRAIYIAGPMSGITDWNHAAFGTTAAVLRSHSWAEWEVFSPAELFDGDVERPRAHYMRAGLDRLVGASSAQPWRPAPTDVVLLPGWEASRGAMLEVMVAQELGLRVWTPQGEQLPQLVVQQWIWPKTTTRPVLTTADMPGRNVGDLEVEGDGDSTVHVTAAPSPARSSDGFITGHLDEDWTGLGEVAASMPSPTIRPQVESAPKGPGQCRTEPVVRLPLAATERAPEERRDELARLGRAVQAAGRRIEAAALLDDMPKAAQAGEGLDELAALVIAESMPLQEGCR